jgi:hypothetical protein
VDALLEVAGPDQELPLAMVELRLLGGALGRPAAVPNAVAGRDAAFSCWTVGPMFPPLADVVPAIAGSIVERMAPWSTGGALLNFVGGGSQEVSRLWNSEDRERLQAVKRRVDPERLFRHGHVVG